MLDEVLNTPVTVAQPGTDDLYMLVIFSTYSILQNDTHSHLCGNYIE